MRKNKSKLTLQKFTTKEKINNLFLKDVVLKSDTAEFTYSEKKELGRILTDKINSAMGVERESLIKKFYDIIGDDTKNQLWEVNHSLINNSMSALMQDYGRMPTIQEISIKTELSRPTVYNHLREFKKSKLYQEQTQNFEFMLNKVLAKVYHFAVNGDMQAAKLFFSIVGQLNETVNQPQQIIKNQNNYIQINNTVIDQEKIKQLNAEQLSQIEAIIKNVPYLIKKV